MPDYWDRYSSTRGQYVESVTAELISRALGTGSQVWERIEWESSEGDEASEIDVLARQDATGIRVQCKGGRFTAPARRGALKRMDTEFRELIGEAAEQHRRLAAVLQGHRLVLTNPEPELIEALTDPPLQFEMIVTLEDLGLFGAQMFLLEEFGTLSPTVRLPYLVSLNDLRVITDVLDGPEFVHYLARRERLNRIRRVIAQDELDYLGNYLSDGLYFDEWAAEDPNGYFRLLSFTEEFDNWYFAREGLRTVETPKPTRDTSEQGARLIEALKGSRPSGWIIPSISILDWSSDSQKDFDLQWDAAMERARESGESSFTFEFLGKYRFTMAFALDANLDLLNERLDLGQSRKIEEGGFPLGISVGRLPPANAYTVALTSTDLPTAIDIAFLEPNLGAHEKGATEEE